MSTLTPTSSSTTSFSLKLETIKQHNKDITDRIHVAGNVQIQKNRGESPPLIKRPGTKTLNSEEVFSNDNESLNLLWSIQQHCRGSLEDLEFLKNANIPQNHDNELIASVYRLFHEVKSADEPKKFDELKELTASVALQVFQVKFNNNSPFPLGELLTPSSTDPNSKSSNTSVSPDRTLNDTPQIARDRE